VTPFFALKPLPIYRHPAHSSTLQYSRLQIPCHDFFAVLRGVFDTEVVIATKAEAHRPSVKMFSGKGLPLLGLVRLPSERPAVSPDSQTV
jgi:hypothetical protein